MQDEKAKVTEIDLGPWANFVHEAPVCMDVRDLEGRLRHVNREFERLHDVVAAEVIGKRVEDVFGPICGGGMRKRDEQVAACGERIEIEYMIDTPKGIRTVHRIAFPLRDEDERVVAVGGVATDVSERRAAEISRSSDTRYRALFDQAPVSIWEEDWSDAKREVDVLKAQGVEDFETYFRDHPEVVWDMAWECSIVDFNETTVSMYGAPSKPAFWEYAIADFCTEDAFEAFRETLTAFARGETRTVVHAWEKTFDDSDIYVRDTVFIPAEYHQSWARVMHVNEDISDSHRLARKLSYEATHDALTGLVNRREFEARLRRVLESVRTEDSEHALCYLDLDQFKVLNDGCGHMAGDELLRQLARDLSRKVRRHDTLARLGGDEFGLLMEHCPLGQASHAAEILRKTVEASRFQWQGHSFQVGVSIGLVPITRAMASITDLLSAADSACYTAKDLGRNRIHVYDQADTTHLRRHGEMRWAARIDQALENDGLTLSYQSIRPLSHKPAGEHIEILLRLKDGDSPDELPAAFMRAAERYDLASRVDRWVVDHCLQWLELRPDIVERLELCAINVSSRSIDDDGFAAFLQERLNRSTVPAQRLCIEITETSLIGDLGRASAFMVELKARGCKFALDDFGSGVSSFAYLKRLPVDFVKIDGSFVRNVVATQSDRAIVRSINEVAHSLGTRTVAECVESREVEDALRDLGVDFAQGYAIANVRPLASFD